MNHRLPCPNPNCDGGVETGEVDIPVGRIGIASVEVEETCPYCGGLGDVPNTCPPTVSWCEDGRCLPASPFAAEAAIVDFDQTFDDGDLPW